ncbi:hypothetical protein C0J52_04750 [Blattella germanica]|nr:hypothetical protein C0J52_04750 [Blattella germanica]
MFTPQRDYSFLTFSSQNGTNPFIDVEGSKVQLLYTFILLMSLASTIGIAVTATRAFPSLKQYKWSGAILVIIYISLLIIYNEILYNYVHMETAIIFE